MTSSLSRLLAIQDTHRGAELGRANLDPETPLCPLENGRKLTRAAASTHIWMLCAALAVGARGCFAFHLARGTWTRANADLVAA